MPITLVHQPNPAAVGMASYAAGVGQANERKRKYTLDLWQNQQQQQAHWNQQLMGYKYQSALADQRESAQQARWEAGQQAQQARFEAGQQALQGRFDAQQARMQHDSMAAGLPKIPDHVDTATGNELRKRRAALDRTLRDPRTDWNDPKTAQKIQDDYDAYINAVGSIPKPDPNEGGLWLNPKTQRYEPTPEGQKATHFLGPDGKPIPNQEHLAEIAAGGRAETKAAADLKAFDSKLEHRREAELKAAQDLMENPLNKDMLLGQALEQVRADEERAGITPSTKMVPPGQAAPGQAAPPAQAGPPKQKFDPATGEAVQPPEQAATPPAETPAPAQPAPQSPVVRAAAPDAIIDVENPPLNEVVIEPSPFEEAKKQRAANKAQRHARVVAKAAKLPYASSPAEAAQKVPIGGEFIDDQGVRRRRTK